jgi:nucleotide-binding universal stress UspA family protein
MFQKILVALDCSENRHEVFAKSLDIAKADQASLMLLHVLSFDDPSCPQIPIGISNAFFSTVEIEVFRDFYKQWKDYEQEQLKRFQMHQELASNAGVKCELMLRQGSPGLMICDQARTWQADLIVMGRRGRSGLGELILGSVSTYVTHHAPCSVLIVQAFA